MTTVSRAQTKRALQRVPPALIRMAATLSARKAQTGTQDPATIIRSTRTKATEAEIIPTDVAPSTDTEARTAEASAQVPTTLTAAQTIGTMMEKTTPHSIATTGTTIAALEVYPVTAPRPVIVKIDVAHEPNLVMVTTSSLDRRLRRPNRRSHNQPRLRAMSRRFHQQL